METYTLEFVKGNFAVQKTNGKFSKIGLDHNHEQQNSKIKGVGGTIGLTENDSGLRRWLISGREIARLFEGFELSHVVQLQDGIQEHHDSNPGSRIVHGTKAVSETIKVNFQYFKIVS